MLPTHISIGRPMFANNALFASFTCLLISFTILKKEKRNSNKRNKLFKLNFHLFLTYKLSDGDKEYDENHDADNIFHVLTYI